MPPKAEKRVSADDIIEVFLDPRVIEAITKALYPSITSIIEKCIDDKLTPILAKVAFLSAESDKLEKRVSELSNRYDTAIKSVNDFQTNVQNLEKTLSTLDKKIQGLEKGIKDSSSDHITAINEVKGCKKDLVTLTNYSRRDNLIIHGIQPTSYADASSAPPPPNSSSTSSTLNTGLIESSNKASETAVLELCNGILGLDVNIKDISCAHRLSVNGSRPGSSQQTPQRSHQTDHTYPIIVRFTSRRVRDSVFNAKKQLKGQGSNIYINEHLSPENSRLFKLARQLVKSKKLISAWTNNGVVYTRDSALPTARPRRIQSVNDLPQ